mmetsp:Transcript_24593/g.59287  ORF Transcript_24593/g.59287 Transcript_24593/m.59287 type:complete len:236 (-) Transcript_24593:179-886(-)
MMISHRFIVALLLFTCFLMTANAGLFGAKSNEVETNDHTDNENGYLSMDEMNHEVFFDGLNTNERDLIDLSDEEYLAVMEQFSLLSTEEKKQELMDMLGDGDPWVVDKMKEISKTMDLLGESEEITNSLEGSKAYLMAMNEKDDMTDVRQFLVGFMEAIAKATGTALKITSKADWKDVYNKRGGLLDSIIASGKMSAEDAAFYKHDDDFWEKEVREIWDALQYQARESDNNVNEL